ncbi:MAG: DUF1015 domain-containing protein [Spirochaetaceae bacterium]|nr:MAG: DUF1015 domain-containing protein [Spirochaetaceae bacterium]
MTAASVWIQYGLMNEIINRVKPFRALHYNKEKVGDIGACLSAPYDVISPDLQEQYYKRHPNNVIRLILNKILPNDTDKDNRYARARVFLDEWKKSRVLIQSEHPWFFAYEEIFTIDGILRKLSGFIGLVHLSEYTEGRILPHEKVLKSPVEDRIRLTQTTGTQFEYIWGLYRDPQSEIDKLLAKAKSGEPIVDYREEENGVQHRLWGISDPCITTRIERAMADKKIYIADGHHRYQTMLSIRDQQRAKLPKAGDDADFDYIMMFLVNTSHEGLFVLPTHRLLHGLDAKAVSSMKTGFSKYFSVKEIPFAPGKELGAQQQLCLELVKKKKPSFGVSIAGENSFLLIELSDESAYKKICGTSGTDVWKLLDVNVLNVLVLAKLAGIPEEAMAEGTNVSYVKDADEAFSRVRSGEMQVAFILNSTPLESVLQVSEAGEKMPRKSTYFYPKPLSGLVFYQMEGL